MLAYILQTTLIWTLLLVIYKLLLSREKYFLVNRAYLLSAIVLGLVLPLLQHITWSTNPVPVEVSMIYQSQIEYVSQWESPGTATTPLDKSSSMNWINVLYYIFLAGLIWMSLRFIHSLFNIYRLYRSGDKKVWGYYTEVANEKDHLPFSFLRYIFYSLSNIQEKDKSNIITHELYHVKARHTWDVLFVEVIKIIFWWNPLPYIYKSAIVENHEYAADAHVLKDASRKQYCTLLLQTNYPDLNLPLTHPFFQSFIKKRIKMMYQKKSSSISYLKMILPLCLIVSMAFVITSHDDRIDKELQNIETSSEYKKHQSEQDQTYKVDTIRLMEDATIRINHKTVKIEKVVELMDLCYESDISVRLADPESNEFNIIFLPEQKVSVNKKIMSLQEFKKWIITHNKIPGNKYNVSYDKALSNSEIKTLSSIISNKPFNVEYEDSEYQIDFNNFAPKISECQNKIDALSCTFITLMDRCSGSQYYTDKLLEAGYEGMIHYSLLINSNGELHEVQNMNTISTFGEEFEKIAIRIKDDLKKNYTFMPAKKEGRKIEGHIPLLLNLKLSADQMDKVAIRNAATHPNNQLEPYINYITDQGYLAYRIKSEWNVPAKIEITDPTGANIQNTEIDYIYKAGGGHFFLPKKLNGIYKIKATQDGQSVETEYICEVF